MKIQLLMFTAVAFLGTSFAHAAAPKRQQRSDTATNYRSSAASGGHNQAGCGLGSMVIEDNSKWAQVGASFLNGTGFQTFAITFGTSNCTEDGVASASREKDAFVESNLADIRRDLSVGSGDYLSSLASLYGCKGEQAAVFGSALRKHQDALLNAAPAAASRAIDSAVTAEKVSCQG
jgi:hypothetical protein